MLDPSLGFYFQIRSCSRNDGKAIQASTRTEQFDKRDRERPDPPEGETPTWFILRNVVDPDTKERLPFEMSRCELPQRSLWWRTRRSIRLHGFRNACNIFRDWTRGRLRTQSEGFFRSWWQRDWNWRFRLSYLNAVIKEGLRVTHMISNGLPRFLYENMTILGHRLPKGTVIVFPGNRAVNIEADWGDPDVVRPERWLTGEDMSSKYCHAFELWVDISARHGKGSDSLNSSTSAGWRNSPLNGSVFVLASLSDVITMRRAAGRYLCDCLLKDFLWISNSLLTFWKTCLYAVVSLSSVESSCNRDRVALDMKILSFTTPYIPAQRNWALQLDLYKADSRKSLEI